MPNPFSLIDRLDFDFDLPPAPAVLERADHWFDRLSEIQRIGAGLMIMLFLAAAAFYCLGLGSTVLVNRAEAEFVAQQAAQPTVVPTVEVLPPTSVPLVTATPFPTPRQVAKPTQVVEYPTPIPPQFLPSVPAQAAPAQRAAQPADSSQRPRVVAPYEPPTPTPPVRQGAPAAKPSTSGNGTTGSGTAAPAAKPSQSGGTTPAPAAPSGPSIIRTQPPTTNGTRAPATSAPAAKPGQPATGATQAPAAKPTSAPPIQSPLFPSNSAAKPTVGTTPAAKPSTTR